VNYFDKDFLKKLAASKKIVCVLHAYIECGKRLLKMVKVGSVSRAVYEQIEYKVGPGCRTSPKGLAFNKYVSLKREL
jgi:hypothetical protein